MARGGVTPDLGPADSVGEALSNVGQAFLGNLLGGGPGSVAAGGAGVGGAATPGEAPSGGTPEAAGTSPDATVKLSQGDVETLHALIERYSRARSARAYIDLPDLCVSAQRNTAVAYYERLAELHATYANLVQAYDRVEAGTRATFDAQLAEALPVYELIQLAAVDADSARGSLRPKSGGESVSVTFRREAGFWRIEDLYVPAAAKWGELEAKLDETVESLNEIDNDLLDEKPVDAARVREALTKAVDLLAGKKAV
jgi:hypothetical protein